MLKEAIIGNAKTVQYRRRTAKTLEAHQIKNKTMLLCGLTKAGDQFIASGFCSLGYNAVALPTPTNEAMELGKEYCDSGLCNPTYYTVGNLLLYLENLKQTGLSANQIMEDYIYITAGSCGPCRFGMYEYQYENALEKAGYGGFQIIIVQSAGGLKQKSEGLQTSFDVEFFRSILNAVLLSDVLNTLKYKIMPYEVEPGQTQKVFDECVQLVNETLRGKIPLKAGKSALVRRLLKSSPGEYLINIADQVYGGEIKKALKECGKKFRNIRVNYMQPKPVVKITGEFWAAMTEGEGNYNMYNYLQSEGCQILVEPCSTWFFYLMWLAKKLNKERLGALSLKYRYKPVLFIQSKMKFHISNLALRLAEWFYKYSYKSYTAKTGSRLSKEPSMEELSKLSSQYIHSLYEGGEGFMEVAKNIYYTKNRLAHMVLSIKPFGCMPSTMSDAAQSRVMRDYNNMVFLPLETSGDGKINALSRVQMALGEAREYMRLEHAAALEQKGYELKDWKMIIDRYTKTQSALKPCRIPRGYTMPFSGYFLKTVKSGKR